jgi:hypothetical protein
MMNSVAPFSGAAPTSSCAAAARLHRRINDRAPEHGRRADLYQPHGFDRHLPDYADISLHRG